MKMMWVLCAITLLVACGETPQKPKNAMVRKTPTKKTAPTSEEINIKSDSFKIELGYNSDISNLRIDELKLDVPIETNIKSVDLNIVFGKETIWSKKVRIGSRKNQKVHVYTNNFKAPEKINYPATYRIVGTSDVGTMYELIIQIKDVNIIKSIVDDNGIKKSFVQDFINEYGRHEKIVHDFSRNSLVILLNSKNRLQSFLFDRVISELYGKAMFSKTFDYDCTGFSLVNNMMINYDYGKQSENIDIFFFSKGSNFYGIPIVTPNSGILEGEYYDLPNLEKDGEGKTHRSDPPIKKPSQALEKLGESKSEITFGDESLRFVFDKNTRFFTKAYQIKTSE